MLNERLGIKLRWQSDLKITILRSLLDSGAFDEFGEEVKATAYLESKGIREENFIKEQFPKYPLGRQKQLIARVYQIYRDKKPKLVSDFEKFQSSLTTKQANAIKLVYMAEEPLSLPEAAARLGISLDTLRDRIRGALKKLEAAFPELVPATRSSGSFDCDLLYRWSLSQIIGEKDRATSAAEPGNWDLGTN